MPGAVEFISETSPAVGDESALAGKTSIEGKSTAYVCVGPVCGAPAQDAEALRKELLIARSETPDRERSLPR
jgi:uncharacterized protein